MYLKSGPFIYFAVFSVNFISFSTGGGYAWSSPVIPKLNNEISTDNPLLRSITTTEASWISSIVNIGALFGTFISGFLSRRIGKKKTLLIFSLPMVISQFMCAFATKIEIYFIARCILGLGIGCTFSLVPNFIAELSDVKSRGLLTSLFPFMLSTGMIYEYIFGPFVSIKVLSFLNVIPIVLFIFLFGFLVPETPYFFMGVNDSEGAIKSLKKFRNTSAINLDKELKTIGEFVEASKNNQGSFRDLIKSGTSSKGLVITCILMVFQQFSGINAVLSYMQSIFELSGSVITAENSVILVGLINIVSRGVASLLLDVLGRRLLLIISGIGSFVSLALLAVYFNLQSIEYDLSLISWLPITCLLAYIVSFNLGLGPVPWVITGEIFSLNVKPLACSISTFICVLSSFQVIMFYPHLSEALGISTSFWIFSISSGLSVIFSVTCLPETKGRSFLEIQNLLDNNLSKG